MAFIDTSDTLIGVEISQNDARYVAPGQPVEVTFKFIAERTAAYAALMAGDVDAFSNYPAPESFAQFAAEEDHDAIGDG